MVMFMDCSLVVLILAILVLVAMVVKVVPRQTLEQPQRRQQHQPNWWPLQK